MFCSTATIDSETEATARSSATVRRSDEPPANTGSGRTAATQPVTAQSAGPWPPDQARTAA